MKHVKSVNEFFSFNKAKENFRKGQEMAKEYISKNPEILDEVAHKIEQLTPEERTKLENAKSKLDNLAKKPEVAEDIIGESNLNESSRLDSIIDKIGAFLGIGSILTTLLGGLGSLIYGGFNNQPLFVIIGIISTLIGIGLTNMSGGEEDRNITI
jgi:hypothetical protein